MSESIKLMPLEIDDDYEHIDTTLEYVLENIFDSTPHQDNAEHQKLQELCNSLLMNECNCGEARSDCSDCSHGGNYKLHSTELVLKKDKPKQLLYECSALCHCNPVTCCNRLVQKGPRKQLRIIDSAVYKSKGLITLVDIPAGGFICEYAGELLTPEAARLRIAENESNGCMNYILCLNEMEVGGTVAEARATIVDPSRKGNIGRYMNHSCEPNCEIISVRVDCPVPKIAIFAKRTIRADEELCFDYSEGVLSTECDKNIQEIFRIPCLCGSNECRKYLPNVEI